VSSNGLTLIELVLGAVVVVIGGQGWPAMARSSAPAARIAATADAIAGGDLARRCPTAPGTRSAGSGWR